MNVVLAYMRIIVVFALNEMKISEYIKHLLFVGIIVIYTSNIK